MQVSVKVEIPDGYELACDEMRQGTRGEYGIGYDGRVFAFGADSERKYIIVRKVWQWPTWLKAPWIAMDCCGVWWAYASKPVKEVGMWQSAETYGAIVPRLFNFSPPPCDDWEQSLRRNPKIAEAA